MLPYYFFAQNTLVQHIFLLVLYRILLKNRKKYANFLHFFLVVYQQVRRNLKKKFVKTLDNF